VPKDARIDLLFYLKVTNSAENNISRSKLPPAGSVLKKNDTGKEHILKPYIGTGSAFPSEKVA
jgi:hypothetical protein